ncbi:hypothetical protein JW962_02025 [Candidatus Dojkabacteria bacterium]|nr:hypothetical protein [Candidatus Dojkabacteria bacterium]
MTEKNKAKGTTGGVIATVGSIILVNALTAACPLCLVAVSASAGLSKYLGVDDTITGTWLGAIAVTIIFMIISAFDKKGKQFPGRNLLITLSVFTAFLIPLTLTGLVGNPQNVISYSIPWGIDKLLFGMAVGSITFVIFSNIHNLLKQKNNGKSFFPFQKVVLPVAGLLLTSIILYFIYK